MNPGGKKMFLLKNKKQRKLQLKSLLRMKKMMKDGRQCIMENPEASEESDSVVEAIKAAELIAKEASKKAALKAEATIQKIKEEEAEKARKERIRKQKRQDAAAELWKIMSEIQGKLYKRRKVVMINGMITVSVPGLTEEVSPCVHRPASPVSIALVGMKLTIQNQLMELLNKM